MAKSTEQLMRENNVKSLHLNNTDREIFENYMTYIRADLRVNPHDSEVMLNRILKHLLKAENKGMLAMDFFNHNPKAHAVRTIKELKNETVQNIFKYIWHHILFLLGIFCFFKGFIGFFIGEKPLYLYTFPITLLAGLFIIFLFVWWTFKTVQIQAFNNSNWVWLLTYAIIFAIVALLFYVVYIPQSFLAFGPHVKIANWTFIIISFIITPLAFYVDHHYIKKDSNTYL
ncbi:membrane protein [Staphylococcus piscifermentans]|uniref:DUF1129 family protein n=1 Tax=Staphylococcus piscifermentans TaxID=70258 RepID=A0A239UGN1_9STAP|nr:DUF1129 family protein [Staphylococcus piscifermentans]RTX84901.1 DUF1129 family protein [Staphylococcus piscifermentans]GEP83836.1 hypothetical protein SPI02_04210 [Staphylococcus piscifermentans]SNV08234.1 membrane protein [Staphylococcus piscifermentans]